MNDSCLFALVTQLINRSSGSSSLRRLPRRTDQNFFKEARLKWVIEVNKKRNCHTVKFSLMSRNKSKQFVTNCSLYRDKQVGFDDDFVKSSKYMIPCGRKWKACSFQRKWISMLVANISLQPSKHSPRTQTRYLAQCFQDDFRWSPLMMGRSLSIEMELTSGIFWTTFVMESYLYEKGPLLLKKSRQKLNSTKFKEF